MNNSLFDYNTFIFDCDGVVLNSNYIKTEAFYETTIEYGKDKANELVKYHIARGGISRYEKFKYFITDILDQKFDEKLYNNLTNKFSSLVLKKLSYCEISNGLHDFRKKTKKSDWLIVSGGDQIELINVFKKRGLNQYFNKGIFGSPESKERILEREIVKKGLTSQSVYIGDSKYDFKAANQFNIDFIFLYEWSEVENYKCWTKEFNIKFFKNINDLNQL